MYLSLSVWYDKIDVYQKRLSVWKKVKCKGIFICKAPDYPPLEVNNEGGKMNKHTHAKYFSTLHILFRLKVTCRTTH